MAELHNPFERLGGEPAVRHLVDRFYDLLDSLPEVAAVRAMHPPDLAESRDKLYWFLCGYLGGPPHYVARRGQPRLRARHLPFAIDNVARDQWLLCMDRALAEVVPADHSDLAAFLRRAFAGVADHMRNRPG